MTRGPAKRWLLAAALPLSIATLQGRSARAQSIPPLRQSLPPRSPSLPPNRPRRHEGVQAPRETSGTAPASARTDSAASPTAPLQPGADPAPSLPDDPALAPEQQGYFDGSYLSTDWGGSRTRMLEHGIDLQLQYTAETFARIHGGTESAKPRSFLGSIVASLDMDTGALGAWPGGVLHIQGQHLHGSGVSEDHLGSIQSASNLEAEPLTTLAEYWFRQELLDGGLAFKVGKQEGNTDFAASDHAGHLLDSSFGAFPTLALSTYPDWGLGVAAFVSPTAWLTVQTAVFDGAPDGDEPFGGTTAFRGDGGHLFVGELQVHGAGLMGTPAGTLKLGGWYHTAETPELPAADNAPERAFGHNHGLYGIVDQKLYQPSGEGRESQGLGVFLQAGYSPQDRNETRAYLGGGLALTGLPGRPDDVVALGCGHVNLAHGIRALEGRTSETVLELTYRAQLSGFLTLQPDVQYFVHPGGDPGVPNATVVGIRMVASL